MGINLLRSNSISCEPATNGIKESMATPEESGVPELSPVSVAPNTRCGVHAGVNISSMYHAVVVSPNEAYGAIDKHEQATTGNREDNCVAIEGVPPPDVSQNMAYSPHENVSPRNALANAIAINPNEAYGVHAGVNVSSTNHPTDAAIVVNPNEAYAGVNISSMYHAVIVSPNEAYGAIDKHEQTTTGNRENNCVTIADVPPLDVSPNMAYSPHENVSPRNALANAIAINPNEAYGVHAGVNVSSTNHPTDAAIVVNPNEAYGVHAGVNISSTYDAVVVSPNEAYGAIDKHEQATTGNREDNCVAIEGVPPPDVSPNMAYSPHENVSPRNALVNAIAINPNEAYGVHAGVNVSSTNHPTDAAIVVNPNEAYGVHAGVNVSSTNHPTDSAVVLNTNEAYGAIDKHEQATTGNREDNCVAIEGVPPPDVSPNMAYSPHENVSPRNALANAIAINPNEAYGVHAGVNVSSTNHPTDAAVVLNTNEAYGVHAGVNVSSTNHPTDSAVVLNTNEAYRAIDTHEKATTGNREDKCVAIETDYEYSYVTV